NLQLERANISNEIADEETMVGERMADLEKAVGIPIKAGSITSSLGIPAFPYRLDLLDSLALEHRPQLRKLRAEAEQEQLRLHRTELDAYPDFQVSLAYMQRDALTADAPMNPIAAPMKQSDMISAGVSFDLPFNNNKRTEALSESEAMRTMKHE